MLNKKIKKNIRNIILIKIIRENSLANQRTSKENKTNERHPIEFE